MNLISLHFLVIKEFQVCRLPELDGKPKLFIYNACQGGCEDKVVLGKAPRSRTPSGQIPSPLGQDVFQGFPCAPGYATLIHANKEGYGLGCNYIQVYKLMSLGSALISDDLVCYSLFCCLLFELWSFMSF